MNIRSKISYVVAGFVGGMAFLVSCSGGSGGGLISDAEAAVPAEQMFCKRVNFSNSSANNLVSESADGIPNGIPVANSLACYDTLGVSQTTSLDVVYSQGWRILIYPGTGSAGIVIFVR